MSVDRPPDRWGDDGFFFTEAARGGPLTWPRGADRLAGDALGPVRHAHDDAAEYFYMYAGSVRLEVGGENLVLEPGQLCYVPPDAPHNVLGSASDADARLFCVVAPNFPGNRWRTSDFRRGSDRLRASVATAFQRQPLPGGGNLQATDLVLTKADAPIAVSPVGHESVYLIVDGELAVVLETGLGGDLAAGGYLHVRDGVAHTISTPSACRALRVECAFAMWSP